MHKKPVVIVYRDHLLPPSETFVRSQGEELKCFTPYYVGSRLEKGLTLPTARTLAVNCGGMFGKAQEALYKVWNIAPGLYQRVQLLNPVLIHAHFGVGGALALPLAQTLGVPLVVTFHGFDATVKDEYARRSFYGHRVYLHRREVLKHKAQLFIAVSEFIKGKLLAQGFPPNKIVVHYTGVDTEAFRPDLNRPREPIVLFVGRLVEKKGCEYLIQAMSKVQAVRPEVELLVIGDGPLRLTLEKLAQKKLRRYRFLGVQPSEAVRTWMNRAKVFSVPSITAESGNSEGFGMVFAEAQVMGLPVVSFATGGVSEAVAHEKTGFLVAERDWEGLAKHILLLFENDTLFFKFSEAGYKRVQALFDLKKQTRVLEEIYHTTLGESCEVLTCN